MLERVYEGCQKSYKNNFEYTKEDGTKVKKVFYTLLDQNIAQGGDVISFYWGGVEHRGVNTINSDNQMIHSLARKNQTFERRLQVTDKDELVPWEN